ncbi:MAG: 4Fe-4S binding protein [Candidatus Omnitrophica bacterium]|nr:4Fe-4S binding protein [Candidatus Omnitrophota bacterium]
MKRYFMEILNGLTSLLEGLGVTFRYAFKKPVTFLYPKEEIVPECFKGPIVFKADEVDGTHKCVACMACVKACPSRCIDVSVEKNAEGKRILTVYRHQTSLCSLCGSCVEVCPTDALKHDASAYDEVAVDRAELFHDFLEPFRKKGIDVTGPIRTAAQRKTERQAGRPASEAGS